MATLPSFASLADNTPHQRQIEEFQQRDEPDEAEAYCQDAYLRINSRRH